MHLQRQNFHGRLQQQTQVQNQKLPRVDSHPILLFTIECREERRAWLDCNCDDSTLASKNRNLCDKTINDPGRIGIRTPRPLSNLFGLSAAIEV